MSDLTTALNFNEAMLLEDSDAQRLDYLNNTLLQLEYMMIRGRAAQQELQAEKSKILTKDVAVFIKESLNQSLNPESEDFKKDVQRISDSREGIARTKNVSKRFFDRVRKFLRDANTYIGLTAAQDMTGLIDQIAEFPGVVFGGQLQQIVTARVNESTRNYKERILQFKSLFETTIQEYYGKNWRKVYKQMNQIDNIFYKNKSEVDKARKEYNANQNNVNKRNLDEIESANKLIYSQEEMAYMLNNFKDPALLPTFENMYGENYQEVIDEMDSKLDDRVRAFADWQIREFYPAMRARFNQTYKNIYYTDMPYNKYYSGAFI